MKKDRISIILLWASITLCILKFTYYPEISWGWVFAPLCNPCAIGIIGFFAVVVFFSILKRKK